MHFQVTISRGRNEKEFLQVHLWFGSEDLVGWYPRMIRRQLAIATQRSNNYHGCLRSTVKDAISALRISFPSVAGYFGPIVLKDRNPDTSPSAARGCLSG